MIDTDSLRDDLTDYFGTAMQVNPIAMMDLINVQRATPSELENIAINNGFNPQDYDDSNDFSLRLTRR